MLTTYLDWRWIFYINLPIGLVGFLMARRYIRKFDIPAPTRFDLRGFLIAGVGLACFAVAVEGLGHHVAGMKTEVTLFVIFALLCGAYAWHARRVANPVIDLSLFRVDSFRIATLAGGVNRFSIGAVPFLLPLLFQLGFGLGALQSGMLTFVTSIGAMVNKTVVRRILSRTGFRRLLTVNGVLLGLMIAGLSLLQPTTPHLAVWAYLLLLGFIRSVQVTSVNALGYADLTPEIMSKGTSIASVAQQLSMSLGVAIAATLLSLEVGAGGHITTADFPPVFVAIGVLSGLAAVGFLGLRPEAGAHVTGQR